MRHFIAVFACLLFGDVALHAQSVDPTGNGPCGGQSTYTYNGTVYRLAEIGGQCWFADNLRTTTFQNGDAISYADNGTAWNSSISPRRGVWENNNNLSAVYGYFYNFPAVTDSRGLCPSEYRVPQSGDFAAMISAMISLYGNANNSLFRAPGTCLLYTSPSPRDRQKSRMPSSA